MIDGPQVRSRRVLVGAIGYRNLRDHSAAFEAIERLSSRLQGTDVVVEDASYNPIALVQWLDSLEAAERFDTVIFIAALSRAGRPGGDVSAYRWDGRLPSDQQVQQSVTEAVTGIINLDNTLTVAGYFKALPGDVAVVEIEPVDHAFGPEFSAPVLQGIAEACGLIEELSASPLAMSSLPVRSLAIVEALDGRGV